MTPMHDDYRTSLAYAALYVGRLVKCVIAGRFDKAAEQHEQAVKHVADAAIEYSKAA